MDVVATTIVEETGKIILACGLSCCLSSVVDVEIMDLDVATDLDVAAKVYSFCFLILTSKGAVVTDSTFSKYL